MKRSEFHDFFTSRPPIIIPVIHVKTHNQVQENIQKLLENDVTGCFLINHDFGLRKFLPIIRSIRSMYPNFWIGLNFLAVTGLQACPILESLEHDGFRVDAYWADDARIDERIHHQVEANEIAETLYKSSWKGIYFGGTAFKKQRLVSSSNYLTAAKIASQYMDVVTTSGTATGNPADIKKIHQFRAALPDTPLALASGITPHNAFNYSMVDCFMVATGINVTDDFYTIDPDKLRLLISRCKEMRNYNEI